MGSYWAPLGGLFVRIEPLVAIWGLAPWILAHFGVFLAKIGLLVTAACRLHLGFMIKFCGQSFDT